MKKNDRVIGILERLQTNGIHEIVNRLLWDDVKRRDLAGHLQSISQDAHKLLQEIESEKQSD